MKRSEILRVSNSVDKKLNAICSFSLTNFFSCSEIFNLESDPIIIVSILIVNREQISDKPTRKTCNSDIVDISFESKIQISQTSTRTSHIFQVYQMITNIARILNAFCYFRRSNKSSVLGSIWRIMWTVQPRKPFLFVSSSLVILHCSLLDTQTINETVIGMNLTSWIIWWGRKTSFTLGKVFWPAGFWLVLVPRPVRESES